MKIKSLVVSMCTLCVCASVLADVTVKLDPQKTGAPISKYLYGHELFRNSDLFYMANYAQTVNVLGCIKVTNTAADMATTALPLELYHRHFGTIPIAVSGATGNLDFSAAWTKDKTAVTVAIVNPDPQDQPVKVDLGGLNVKEKAKRWLVGSANPESDNEPGQPPNVVIQREKADIENSTLLAPRYSIAMYRLEVR